MSPLDDVRVRAVRDDEHGVRTLRAIATAVARVPFYAKLGWNAPGEDAATSLDEALRKMPLLTREKMRASLPKAWLPEGRDAKAELASGRLHVLEVGASDARVRIVMDGAWWTAQETRALTVSPRIASAFAGAYGPYKDAVLWVPERGTGSCGAGDPAYADRLEGARLHLNSRQDPTFWSDVVMDRMLDELAEHETVGLLSDPFYLDVLARHAGSRGRKLHARGFVALTRALTTARHRSDLDAVTDAPCLQVYGAREAATLFVQGDDGLLHHAPFSTHVELLPAKVATPGAADVALVVVTTLDRDVQPLVRYVLGDLVQVARGVPGTFTTVAPLRSVEGRLEDALLRPDGALVTAGAVDRALAHLAPAGYQLTQRAPDAVQVEIAHEGGADAAALDAVRAALADLLTGLRLDVRAATAIAVEANGKVRTCRRTIPLSLTSAFEGITP
jgi:phenylacetate-coenzyme A ligase PaaK-like adenylate-forming protein